MDVSGHQAAYSIIHDLSGGRVLVSLLLPHTLTVSANHNSYTGYVNSKHTHKHTSRQIIVWKLCAEKHAGLQVRLGKHISTLSVNDLVAQCLTLVPKRKISERLNLHLMYYWQLYHTVTQTLAAQEGKTPWLKTGFISKAVLLKKHICL